MRYMMKQKFWSVGDKFFVKDENNNDVFYIEGKAFSIGDKLKFLTAAGEELFHIAEKFWGWKKRYRLLKGDKIFAEVIKEWTLFNDRYTVNVEGQLRYSIIGNFSDHEYSFSRNGKEVARVSKEYFTISDTYGIDTDDGEDDSLILASVIVIDKINDNKNRNDRQK